MYQEETPTFDFKAIRLKLASPQDMLSWSHGEVTKPETINYRTQKPEKAGLFAEEIFGPSKDWECYCGKYKRIRYKGIVCDKCGVEVTRSIVRRERMGHIGLAAPVSHIWFLRGVPSKIGLCLDLSVQELEKVIYFANFIITNVDENLRQEMLKQIGAEYDAKKKQIETEFTRQQQEIKQLRVKDDAKSGKEKINEKKLAGELEAASELKLQQLKTLQDAVELAKKELKSIAKYQIVTEQQYQDLSLKYGHVFTASIGAAAMYKLLSELELDEVITRLDQEAAEAPENKKRRIVRRVKLFKNFKKNGLRPEWMILTIIPVIPPDLRPMVQLDGGRFATSDLNDLYRRVINRNNRLKRLIELNAPEVIQRNERRMLQEAVDALIDNGARHGKTVTASTGQKRMLKSIADMLKGKQGRFRQNLLGKRVDYSGRSVIVIGPHLKLYQCGLPKRMALELFRPFVISQLIKREIVHNVRSAGRYIEAGHAIVWDILEEITRSAHVLLNRAPTLHRLGIQAFQPILIEGKAIQIHPLVCQAFNADFDGDQMAVHVPLTEESKLEAAELMLSSKNLLKPATGTPVVSPQQDIVLGCYYISIVKDVAQPKAFADEEEAILAHSQSIIGIQTKIRCRIDGQLIETSVGRIYFNRILPKALRFVNEVLNRRTLTEIVSRALAELGSDQTVQLLDDIKALSFEFLTRSGISWGMDDLQVPADKPNVIKEAEQEVDDIQQQYEMGLLTDQERHAKVINVWAQAKEKITGLSKDSLDRFGPVFAMIDSGARGSWAQISQMMGMKGLVSNPAGGTIELPVKRSFKEGFDVLEYFISTHGARKGLSDTALRTANAGYLTRRLIDVAQDIVITLQDCGDDVGTLLTRAESEDMGETLFSRIIGRAVAEPISDPKTKKAIVKKGEFVTREHEAKLTKLNPAEVRIRSVLSCRAKRGVCVRCYGYDLGYNRPVALGTAVGIIAAQSIGEPGTQLTMRTFHTGGVAGQDITQGLPRVEELFEARPVKKPAYLSEVNGRVKIEDATDHKVVKVHYRAAKHEVHELPKKVKKGLSFKPKVKDGAKLKGGEVVAVIGEEERRAATAGTARVTDASVTIVSEQAAVKEYNIPTDYALWVKEGDLVAPGTPLTDGSFNLFELFRLQGREVVQRYVIREIQYIYSSQGQKLNDKHIEIIVRQMFSRNYVVDAGETDLLAGEILEKTAADAAIAEAVANKQQAAKVEQLLLGITKASLTTESFLSAASFQETARVLIDAAVSGKVDYLRGLKENVIIGKLIPAGTAFRDVDDTSSVDESQIITI
ncbi:MAG: DNA-directed RNA polymerase subunit beta' [Candidatus Kerfeldbacteria bacterium]|nr:DNA-directed RNA polymerase subunit beta' [Candidatus Kerfeldbacteria bacterium]